MIGARQTEVLKTLRFEDFESVFKFLSHGRRVQSAWTENNLEGTPLICLSIAFPVASGIDGTPLDTPQNHLTSFLGDGRSFARKNGGRVVG
jgi:hypothetical protein